MACMKVVSECDVPSERYRTWVKLIIMCTCIKYVSIPIYDYTGKFYKYK